MAVFWYNGQFYTLKKPIFTVLSRNVNYGDGIFETIRIKNGKICYWDFHFERLQKGIQVLGLEPDMLLQSKILLENTILNVVAKNKIKKSVRVKIQVLRSDETGAVIPDFHDTHTLIICTQTLPDVYSYTPKTVILYPDVSLSYSVLSSIKTLNRLPYVLAGIYAQKNNVQDAFLLNTEQEIIETTNSNLFYIIDNELFTPALQSGCLDGVMRRIIMQNFKVTEKAISTKEMMHVQSIFTTNVINGISPVIACKDIKKSFDTEHVIIKDICAFLNTL